MSPITHHAPRITLCAFLLCLSLAACGSRTGVTCLYKQQLAQLGLEMAGDYRALGFEQEKERGGSFRKGLEVALSLVENQQGGVIRASEAGSTTTVAVSLRIRAGPGIRWPA